MVAGGANTKGKTTKGTTFDAEQLRKPLANRERRGANGTPAFDHWKHSSPLPRATGRWVPRAALLRCEGLPCFYQSACAQLRTRDDLARVLAPPRCAAAVPVSSLSRCGVMFRSRAELPAIARRVRCLARWCSGRRLQSARRCRVERLECAQLFWRADEREREAAQAGERAPISPPTRSPPPLSPPRRKRAPSSPPQALERLCALSIVLCATAVKAGLDEGRLQLPLPNLLYMENPYKRST